MKTLSKLTKVGAALALLATMSLSAGHVLAFSDGQIEGGDIYRISNLTQKTGFTTPASANACDLLEYRVRLYNPGSATLTNVHVEATVSNNVVTSNQSTITASAPNADPSTTTGFATVNFSSPQKLSYVAGTTQLLDQNDNPTQNLPDGITIGGTGVNIGNLGPSVTEFVQFQEKVSCPPAPPATPVFSCDAFNITADVNRTVKVSSFSTTATNGAVFKNAVVDWGDKSAQLTSANIVGQSHQYAADGTYTVTATANFTVNGQPATAGGPQCQKSVTFKSNTPPTVTPPTTPPATPAAPAPTALVNTGPGSVAGLFAAATAAGAVAYRWMLSRRLSRQ